MEKQIDNQSAIEQIFYEASSAKAKHVDVRLKFLRDCAKNGILEPTYAASQKVLVDVLTKPLPVLLDPRVGFLCSDLNGHLRRLLSSASN